MLGGHNQGGEPTSTWRARRGKVLGSSALIRSGRADIITGLAAPSGCRSINRPALPPMPVREKHRSAPGQVGIETSTT